MPPAQDNDLETLVDALPMSASLKALARRGGLRRLRKGETLLVEGEPGDTLYIVLAGKLRAFSATDDEHGVIFGYYGPGICVGEMGLDGGPRSASVEAVEKSVCVRIPRHLVEQHLREDPTFAMELIKLVIRRARSATEALQNVALTDVWGRLRPALEALAVKQPDGRWVIDPAPTFRELGKQLVCAHTSVAKALAPLQVGGYVEVGRRRIVILKPLPKRL
jgi:CRP/FNR family transcriptional regulator, cyclic AMP receptor protein